LPPDQVIANVQAALQQQGYYQSEVDGLLGPVTREAIAAYQRDHGLYITSTIDRPTLSSLEWHNKAPITEKPPRNDFRRRLLRTGKMLKPAATVRDVLLCSHRVCADKKRAVAKDGNSNLSISRMRSLSIVSNGRSADRCFTWYFDADFPGEAVFLSGASGAGKTTLLYTLAGLERPESGTVEFEGRNLYNGSSTSQARFRNKKMGFVFRDIFFCPN